MSAIAGALLGEGRGAAPVVSVMIDALAHRGPDGRAVHAAGAAALGHGLLRVLPEAPEQAQPLQAGRFVITADLRLDNRETLIDSLELTGPEMSDAAIVLAAYARWGEACPEHLLGDFAFAIWDDERQSLFCARDQVGVKPFYYHQGPLGFAFASEMRGLLAVPGVSRARDEAWIADFLIGMAPDTRSTVYTDIVRLPPGHHLTITRNGGEPVRYWRLTPGPPPAGDPVVQFRALFREAVRCRLRSARPVAALLSGGLDSSSIACVAADIRREEKGPPLTTLSMVFDDTPEWNERPFIEAALRMGAFEPVFLPTNGHAPFADFATILAEQEGPYLAPSLAMSRRLQQEAGRRGFGVLLDGHGGDEVVAFGYGRLTELAVAGRWLALWKELGGISATFGSRRSEALVGYFKMYGPGRRLMRLRARVARRLRSRQGASVPPLRPHWARYIDPAFARRTGVEARHRAQAASGAESARTEQAHHLAVLTSDMNAYAFEVLDHLTAAAGVEGRYPFWDKRLVEFCLALPAEEKLKDGWARRILRRSMEGLLPPEIQWRRTKLDFGPHIILGMLEHHRALLDSLILEDSDGLGDYVDMAGVQDAYRNLVKQAEAANGYEVQGVWRTVVLALWLRELRKAGALEI